MDALLSTTAPIPIHDAANGTPLPGDGAADECNRDQESAAKGQHGKSMPLSINAPLVPLVLSSYDFSSCTGNRSVIHSPLLPLEPVMFGVRVHTFDIRNTVPVSTEKICETFGISKSKYPQVITLIEVPNWLLSCDCKNRSSWQLLATLTYLHMQLICDTLTQRFSTRCGSATAFLRLRKQRNTTQARHATYCRRSGSLCPAISSYTSMVQCRREAGSMPSATPLTTHAV